MNPAQDAALRTASSSSIWPEGAVTLRVRGDANLAADGAIVDVDVRANDDASSPCIVVR
jgi:hypothetical protein